MRQHCQIMHYPSHLTNFASKIKLHRHKTKFRNSFCKPLDVNDILLVVLQCLKEFNPHCAESKKDKKKVKKSDKHRLWKAISILKDQRRAEVRTLPNQFFLTKFANWNFH